MEQPSNLYPPTPPQPLSRSIPRRTRSRRTRRRRNSLSLQPPPQILISPTICPSSSIYNPPLFLPHHPRRDPPRASPRQKLHPPGHTNQPSHRSGDDHRRELRQSQLRSDNIRCRFIRQCKSKGLAALLRLVFRLVRIRSR